MLNHFFMHKIVEHRHTLLFVGGIATAVVGKKVLESETLKDATTKAMAEVISVKKDAEKAVEDMKNDAEIIVETKE